MSRHLLFFPLCILVTLVPHAISFAVSSPWATATWILNLEFGRQKNSPEDYGVSGNRIVAPITVEIQSESLKLEDTFVGPGASMIVPSTEGNYITLEGQQRLRLSTGGWTLEFPPGKQGLASKVRFWMDLETSLQKNDLILPKGQRLYFAAKAWREDDYERGLKKIMPIQERAREAQARLDDTLSHQTGDRRLDGNDALETLQAYGDMTQLVLERDLARQDLLNYLEKFPPGDQDLPEGPWPGAEEWMTLSNHNNPILIARRSKLLMGEDFYQVGTWTTTPVLSEGDYELVCDEDRQI